MGFTDCPIEFLIENYMLLYGVKYKQTTERLKISIYYQNNFYGMLLALLL